MSYDVGTFTGNIKLVAKSYPFNPNRITELQAIATALGSDTTTTDTTLKTAPAGLRPGRKANTKFTNDCLLIVNAGKAGNLPNSAMAAAITGGISGFIPPTNTTAPTITYTTGGTGAGTVGAVYASTFGVWTPTGATMSRQWLRNGANIGGATAASYTTVVADSGNSISCRVTATNNAGSNSANSNAAAIA